MKRAGVACPGCDVPFPPSARPRLLACAHALCGLCAEVLRSSESGCCVCGSPVKDWERPAGACAPAVQTQMQLTALLREKAQQQDSRALHLDVHDRVVASLVVSVQAQAEEDYTQAVAAARGQLEVRLAALRAFHTAEDKSTDVARDVLAVTAGHMDACAAALDLVCDEARVAWAQKVLQTDTFETPVLLRLELHGDAVLALRRARRGDFEVHHKVFGSSPASRQIEVDMRAVHDTPALLPSEVSMLCRGESLTQLSFAANREGTRAFFRFPPGRLDVECTLLVLGQPMADLFCTLDIGMLREATTQAHPWFTVLSAALPFADIHAVQVRVLSAISRDIPKRIACALNMLEYTACQVVQFRTPQVLRLFCTIARQYCSSNRPAEALTLEVSRLLLQAAMLCNHSGPPAATDASKCVLRLVRSSCAQWSVAIAPVLDQYVACATDPGFLQELRTLSEDLSAT